MSVKAPRPDSRPALATSPRSSSKIKLKDLLDLDNPQLAYKSPLSVVALIDLNCFYAQVERIRLGLSDEDPVVCQQWQSIIAVSYAARKFGISRLDTVQSAKLKCPDLICAHAAVYKKGEGHWAYVSGSPSPVDHKVSLDMYRRESRKILRMIQEKVDLVDKASVDESYVDLGRSVFKRMMGQFPVLKKMVDDYRSAGKGSGTGPGSGTSMELLPPIPQVLPDGIQWEGYVAESDKEMADAQNVSPPPAIAIEDWDDVALIIGAQLLLDLRQTIHDELGYTTSAGLARNRLMAKLSGGFKKPDNQTIVRNCAVNRFLNNFELKDITGFGAKLGDSLVHKFDVPSGANSIAFIRDNYTPSMLRKELRDEPELATKLYQIVRGMHPSELEAKVDIKSMMSTKNFRDNSPWSLQDAFEWLTVYAGDLSNRLLDLDNESMELSMTKVSGKEKGILKRPRTITIGVRSMAFVRQTRQMPIPFHKDIGKMKQAIEECGRQLLREYLERNTSLSRMNSDKPARELFAGDAKNVRIMKMSDMSLTISNFVALNDHAMIESFAKRSDDRSVTANRELMEINNATAKRKIELEENELSKRKPKDLSIKDKQHISDLFKDFNKVNTVNKVNSEKNVRGSTAPKQLQKKVISNGSGNNGNGNGNGTSSDIFKSLQQKQRPEKDLLAQLQETKFCPKCELVVDDPIEHNDFHIAIDLSEKWNR
ncbi:uncharacterized protein LODBEIA_P46100 [Lodderomyces beijingensis]|uniref:DNA polymerase eta n=1 Tax=Lodderomyces beijingensis TaxID=1775926 RepID=A0ABP0ZTE1_9ASCO